MDAMFRQSLEMIDIVVPWSAFKSDYSLHVIKKTLER